MADDIQTETAKYTEKELKRKRSEGSSTSETELVTPKKKGSSKKKKKSKSMDSIPENSEMNTAKDMADIKIQLKTINDKLTNVITKDDGSLRGIIRSLFQEMKDDLLESMSRKVEVLEGRLFEKEIENDKLKKDVIECNKEVEALKEENEQLRIEIDRQQDKIEERLNDYEQYGRRNNIRINGISQTSESESAEQTADIVCKTLNEKFKGIKLSIVTEDIDTAHRLGKVKNGKRQIIVKFKSRITKDKVLQNRKLFKGTRIFISEDLTYTNNLVLQSVRYKSPDEVQSAWSVGGKIFYEDLMGHKHLVKYKDYQHWINMSWPEKQQETEKMEEK